jgi:hypothetical protein
MADEKTIDRTGGVPRAEADVANSGPAVWTNKFMVVLGPIIKIMFMEQGGPEEPLFFRSAVAMSHQDAIALKTLLTRMLADLEKQYEAAMQAAQQAQQPQQDRGAPNHG